MDKIEDSWTVVHDLALIYISLAFGSDHRLNDKELEEITSALSLWGKNQTREQVQEVVIEAAAIFLEGDSDTEVIRSIQLLGTSLSPEERQKALEQVMRIAEADGVLLSSERSIISMLADQWGVKATGKRLIEHSTASRETFPSWTLMHDISLICVVVAHSTDNELSSSEISAIIERLGEWQPDLPEEEVRDIIKEALKFYATEPGSQELSGSVQAIRDSLPVMQRLALLDDLVYIARSDGSFNQEEKDMILSLSHAWQINIRLNGR